MFQTHRLLVALDVMDLPLVVLRSYSLRVALLAMVLCSERLFGCILL